MTTTQQTISKRPSAPAPGGSIRRDRNSTAVALKSPVILPEPEQHPIYRNVPIGRKGFTLKHQSIQVLDIWHERATEAVKAAPPDSAEDGKFYEIVWEIYEASFEAQKTSAFDVARHLEIIVRHAQFTAVEVALDMEKLTALSNQLTSVTGFFAPQKEPKGVYKRGNRLTRKGLMLRYHSFLLEELYTIGWHLYGDRDYLLQFHPYDSAVSTRLAAKRGRHPFFDPAKLSQRAKAVLSRLKINTTTVHPHDRVPAAAIADGER